MAERDLKRRLGWAHEIVALRTALSHTKDPKAPVLVKTRIRALHNLLQNRPERTPADEYVNPKLGIERLQEWIDEAEANASDAEMFQIATYAARIEAHLQKLHDEGIAAGITAQYKLPRVDRNRFLMEGEVKTTIITDAIASGRLDDDLAEELNNAGNVGSWRDLNIEDVDPGLAKTLIEYKAEAERLQALWATAATEYQTAEKNKVRRMAELPDEAAGIKHLEYIEQLRQDSEATFTAHLSWWNTHYIPAQEEANAKLKQAFAEQQSPLKQAGQKIIDDLLQASPITEAEATAWAAKCPMDKASIAKLKKNGYPIEQFRADMAEFYRLTQGRVGTIEFVTHRGRRAQASDIGVAERTGKVHVTSRFGKRTLWHELGHHVEADPVALDTASAFIRRRAHDNGDLYKLSQLTGNSAYGREEVAYKDEFFDAYVGKYYKGTATELFSMGIESFSDPISLATRLKQDPETLGFIRGYLKTPVHPLAKVLLGTTQAIQGVTAEGEQSKADAMRQMIMRLAKDVEFVPSKDDSWWTGGPNSGYYRPSLDGEMEGYFPDTGWYLLSAKLSNYWGKDVSSKRKIQGYKLASKSNYGGIEYKMYPTTDINYIKAAMALYQREGIPPNWYTLTSYTYLEQQTA